MRAFLLSLLATLTLVTACGEAEPTNPALRTELLAMLKLDQEVRTLEASQEDWDRVEKANTDRMRQILDQHGWPGYALVGKDGAQAAWALIQHADRDLELQKRGLELMRRAAEESDADPSDLAFLVDRVRVAEKRPQVYGTQWETDPQGQWRPRTPIEDEANVDERRAESGLKPLREYLEELKSAE
ncbi:DUF6624 domain-containing protein [Nonomuraea gerenzanensis]|uniref:Lipoprotein n=1 Tax=Nonomuraea gerenzanensis TaxID=93944 RepID=A0A1M4EQ85_9ACTN|nr:DUF6624 domain-containing protein [Nonomuraea gerenzanensis]UBU12469.1 hypothetical protein LCN96_50745 [Nonomuraea gerenzanensis]SBP01022.1 hypothetical protein BN4615_P10538 [Nonomuraea gerenzanensis]